MEGLFFIVESSNGPRTGYSFRHTLTDNKPIQSDFIGASVQDCEQWTLEKRHQDKAVQSDIIAIMDERSIRDNTLLILFYAEFSEGMGELGALPPKIYEWYDFRIHYTDVLMIKASLCYIDPQVTFPRFFGRKEELTDEDGVFNVKKAQGLIVGPESVQESIDSGKWNWR